MIIATMRCVVPILYHIALFQHVQYTLPYQAMLPVKGVSVFFASPGTSLCTSTKDSTLIHMSEKSQVTFMQLQVYYTIVHPCPRRR